MKLLQQGKQMQCASSYNEEQIHRRWTLRGGHHVSWLRQKAIERWWACCLQLRTSLRWIASLCCIPLLNCHHTCIYPACKSWACKQAHTLVLSPSWCCCCQACACYHNASSARDEEGCKMQAAMSLPPCIRRSKSQASVMHSWAAISCISVGPGWIWDA